ncbi:hypothetical protein [Hymenobacter sp. BRD67]|uniref:hypothetical protein n=1 Tax=Hymenobacter sp. BRD67 TaxID=2675877 RepID=UPI001563F5F1|nr:hypothetical protein [Hymenobacter sp. BRD67]QKG52932.1 hypothetical protein GKZ67_10330 [Hymenobacter sp. BRD67]
MTMITIGIINYTFCLLSFIPKSETVEKEAFPISLEEKSALAYIRKHTPADLCISSFKTNGRFITFQKELISFDKKYSISYLDSVERASADEKFFTAFNKSYSQCNHEVVFSKNTLDNFLFCEVYPKTGRVFTNTEAYLFRIKNHKAYFIAMETINYN